MLRIYTNKKYLPEATELVEFNDAYFAAYTSSKTLTKRDLDVIKEIDKAEVLEGKRIQTEFGLGTILNLSTGCKTLLNILHHCETVFSVAECGDNVLKLLFSYKEDLSIFMPYSRRFDFPPVEILINNTDIVMDKNSFSAWWSAEYRRREDDDL